MCVYDTIGRTTTPLSADIVFDTTWAHSKSSAVLNTKRGIYSASYDAFN